MGAALGVIRDLNDPALADAVMDTIKAREMTLDPRDVSEGMITVAKLSQRGKRKEAALKFFVEYLNHPRQTMQEAAIRGLGELHHPAAKPLLEPIAANKTDKTLAVAARSALGEIDKETTLVPKEVGELRKEVRELQESQEKLQKKVEELEGKEKAEEKSVEKKGDAKE